MQIAFIMGSSDALGALSPLHSIADVCIKTVANFKDGQRGTSIQVLGGFDTNQKHKYFS